VRYSDKNGHGTHCAGTIFGREVEGTRIGVAPGVTTAFVGKVLGDDGGGTSEMIFRGLQRALEESADVISMSLGFDFPRLVARLVGEGWPVDLATSVALEAYRGNIRMFGALMAMVQARVPFDGGAVVVAAAGNESRREIDPGYEIAVGAERARCRQSLGPDGRRAGRPERYQHGGAARRGRSGALVAAGARSAVTAARLRGGSQAAHRRADGRISGRRRSRRPWHGDRDGSAGREAAAVRAHRMMPRSWSGRSGPQGAAFSPTRPWEGGRLYSNHVNQTVMKHLRERSPQFTPKLEIIASAAFRRARCRVASMMWRVPWR
jgi:subtilisin family serine protease